VVTKNKWIIEQAFIFDLDGVLQNPEKRIKYFQQKDYNKFNELSSKDVPFSDVTTLCSSLNERYKIFFITARPENYRHITLDWIYRNIENTRNSGFALVMRPEGNMESDAEIKKTFYMKLIKKKYKILGVFEDRISVVKMWRHLGLTCYSLPDNF
jgi:hypothetical protein